MSDAARKKAQKLLDAQVQFFMADLSPERLLPLLKPEIEYLCDAIGTVTLSDAVDHAKVKATAQRYAVQMDIGGGIPELFGEIANIIFQFPHNETTCVGDVVSDRIALEFIEKIFEPQSVLDHSVASVTRSASVQAFLSDMVYTLFKSYVLEQNQVMKIGAIASSTEFLRNWFDTKAPEWSDALDEKARNLMAASLGGSLEVANALLENPKYRDTAYDSVLNLWDVIKRTPIARFQNYLDVQDLQDFMVLGYEFWNEFRHTEFLKNCIDAGVDFFFEKYGDETIETLLSDLGVTKDMITQEVMGYAPDLSRLLVEQNIAETLLRRHFERFYFADDTLKIISGRSA